MTENSLIIMREVINSEQAPRTAADRYRSHSADNSGVVDFSLGPPTHFPSTKDKLLWTAQAYACGTSSAEPRSS